MRHTPRLRLGLLPGAVTLLLAMFLASAVPAAQSARPLTNEDILKMVRAELSMDIVLTTIDRAPAVEFDLSPDALVALKEAGVDDRIIERMQSRSLGPDGPQKPAPDNALEKSDLLAESREPEYILRHFRTMLVDAQRAVYFGSDQIKAALARSEDFQTLGITIVDDPMVADVVLEVAYTFAWDYPFSLKHQGTSVVLISGKGSGPFSGPKGATSVVKELVKSLKPHRPGQRKPGKAGKQ